jgi:hypothetical protein
MPLEQRGLSLEWLVVLGILVVPSEKGKACLIQVQECSSVIEKKLKKIENA